MRRSVSFPVTPVIALALIGVIFGFIGLVFLLISNSAKQKAEAAQAWPTTTGTIVKTWVEEDVEQDSDGTTDWDYTPEVQYEYTVDGQSFLSQQVSFGFQTTYSDSRQAERALEGYPLGGKVTVYYDPARPAEAVLDREANSTGLGIAIGWGGSILGLVFILLSSGWFIYQRLKQPISA